MVGQLVANILNIIKTYINTSIGKKHLEWVTRNDPIITKAIKDGLGISDASTTASQLSNIYKVRYANAFNVANIDAQEVERYQTNLTNAKSKLTSLQNKIKGRKARSMSKQKLSIIKSDIRYAQTIVNHWDSELTTAISELTVSSNTLSTNATSVKTKYTALKKLI